MHHILRLCYTSRGALAGTRNSSMGPCLKKKKNPTWVCVGTVKLMKTRKYSIRDKVKDHGDKEKRKKEQMFDLTIYSSHG